MLTKIAIFFQSLSQTDTAQNNETISLEIACTVLLCEVMRADEIFTELEQNKLQSLLISQFSLSKDV